MDCMSDRSLSRGVQGTDSTGETGSPCGTGLHLGRGFFDPKRSSCLVTYKNDTWGEVTAGVSTSLSDFMLGKLRGKLYK